jgi:hypothetical protein
VSVFGTFATELRHAGALVMVPALTLLGAALTWGVVSPGVHRWDDLTGSLVTILLVLGPVAAGVAAWAGGRESRRGTGWLRLLSVRPASHALGLQLAAHAVVVLAGYLVVVAGFCVLWALRGASGTPLALWPAAGVAGLAVFVAVGFTVGVVAPWRITPPLVAAAAYGLSVWVGLRSSWWALLFPAQDMAHPPAFYRPSSTLFAGQIACWTGLLVTGLAVAAVVLDRPGGRRLGLRVAAGGLGLALIGTGGAAVHAQDNDRYPVRVLHQHVCATSPQAQVCVQPDFRAGLAALTRRFGLLSARLAGTPGTATSYVQSPYGEQQRNRSVRGFYLEDLGPDAVDIAVDSVVDQTFPPAACTRSEGEPTWRLVERIELRGMAADWLASPHPATPGSTRSGTGPDTASVQRAARRFADMDERARHTWLAEHFRDVAACRLSPTDVP